MFRQSADENFGVKTFLQNVVENINIRATGIASLIVDRNFRTVLANTDRAVILEKGRVVLENRSDALTARPDELAARLGV